MTYLIPDRKAVSQIKYQLRRFEKQCAELPAETRQLIQQELYGVRALLAERVADRCTDYGGTCQFDRVPYRIGLYCSLCGAPAPMESC